MVTNSEYYIPLKDYFLKHFIITTLMMYQQVMQYRTNEESWCVRNLFHQCQFTFGTTKTIRNTTTPILPSIKVRVNAFLLSTNYMLLVTAPKSCHGLCTNYLTKVAKNYLSGIFFGMFRHKPRQLIVKYRRTGYILKASTIFRRCLEPR